MKSKLVSIIIPTYNYGHLIVETLNCLLSQSYFDWEAIIIDDGSTDNTELVVSTFVNKDNRFTYIKQQNNGVSAARNRGLELAKGEYIQFLDADDLITTDKISLQLQFFSEHKELDICLVQTRFFDNNDPINFFTDFYLENKTSMPIINGNGHSQLTEFVLHNPTVIHSPLFRKDILEKIGYFKEEMSYLEDWDFWFRFAIENLHFGSLYNQKAMALVRVHSVSAMQQSDKLRAAGGKIRTLIHNYLLSSKLPDGLKQQLIIKNNKTLINAYKMIMAKSPLRDFAKFNQFYKEMKNPSAFFKALVKSINIRRKE